MDWPALPGCQKSVDDIQKDYSFVLAIFLNPNHTIGAAKATIELVKLFDNDFKQKINTMMANADNGYIPGECSVESNP